MSAALHQVRLDAWFPDHLRVLRETVEASMRPCPAAAGLVLLIQVHLLCAEMLARQIVAVLPDGGHAPT